MTRPFAFSRLAPCLALALSACATSADAHPRAAPAARVHAAPRPEPRLTVPAGLGASVVAELPGARAMVVGPDGAVYVSQPSQNQVTRLVVRNGEETGRSVAVSGLNRPHGMAFHDGWFYVANTDGVVRVRLDANGEATAKPAYVNHLPGGGGHWTRSIVFGPDGHMYVAAGSHCNICVESDSERAAVMRYDADGSHGRVFARGLRNAVGMAFHPTTHQLWVSQNERDNVEPDHQDLPPEEINILVDGGDYGWPYCYGDRVPNPEFHDTARCAHTIPPALQIQAHSAPLGMTFLTGATQLPAELRGDLLLALHGSWNRTVPTGAKVVLVRVRDGKPASYEDFITGWQRPDGSRWGRPVDVAVLPDGSVLVTDDGSGEIVRVARSAR